MKLGISTVPDEVLIREYEFFTLDHRPKLDKNRKKKFASYERIKQKYKSTAVLHVTNKRLIYTAIKRKSGERGNTSIHQTNIKDVGDITIVDSKWNSLFVPLILMIIGFIVVINSFSDPDYSSIAISILIGIGIFALGILKYMRGKSVSYLAIGSKESSVGLMVGNVSKKFSGDMYFIVRPGKDFETMASELGTLVLDLQSNGDECLERWTSNKCPNCRRYVEMGESFCRDCGANLKELMGNE